MSEVTYIKCDGSGCEAAMTKISYDTDGEALGWTKDDLDADFCPNCTRAASALEADTADAADLASFGEMVGTEADKAVAEAERLGLEKKEPVGVPVVGPSFTKDQLDAALEEVVEDVRKQLKREKKPKKFIEETIRLLREQAAQLQAKEI